MFGSRSLRLTSLLFLSAALASAFPAGAQVTLIGPLPYLSAADSPLDLTAPGFYLEDFEDGALNTPGVAALGAFNAVVKTPSATTDSVDGDDGAIDGSGAAGHSLANVLSVGTEFSSSASIALSFTDAVGVLPTTFAFAITNGAPSATYSLLLTYVGGGQEIVDAGVLQFDALSLMRTQDDRLIGIRSDTGISSARIVARTSDPTISASFQVDHLQYGNEVPEPNAALILSCSIAAACSSRRRARTLNPADALLSRSARFTCMRTRQQ